MHLVRLLSTSHTNFTHNSSEKCFHNQNLPKVIWRNVNRNISVGHIDGCYVTWQCVTYAYVCSKYERGSIPRIEIKITVEVRTLIKQIETRGDPLL